MRWVAALPVLTLAALALYVKDSYQYGFALLDVMNEADMRLVSKHILSTCEKIYQRSPTSDQSLCPLGETVLYNRVRLGVYHVQGEYVYVVKPVRGRLHSASLAGHAK